MSSIDIEQWDRYWAYGNIHSFSQVSGGNYEGVISDFWRARFAGLREGSRVVDIGTGNGAIPLIALEVSERQDKRLTITGTDLADIDPPERVADSGLKDKLRRVEFLGRTPAEALPFQDGSVDMVCSQFGLEYSDLPKSLEEIARVLKGGGALVFIAHHADSVLLAGTHRELEQLDFVLNEVKLYLRARNLLRAMAGEPRGGRGAAGNPRPAVVKKQRALQQAMERIEEAAGRTSHPHMLLGPAQYIREIFGARGRRPPTELQEWLEEAHRRVIANQRRLTDMVAAAMSDVEFQATEGRLKELGLARIDAGPLTGADEALLGWRVEADKPG